MSKVVGIKADATEHRVGRAARALRQADRAGYPLMVEVRDLFPQDEVFKERRIRLL
jgi:hypothetical protein